MQFNESLWRAEKSDSSIRYRMRSDLVKQLNTRQWSLEQTLTQLGPADREEHSSSSGAIQLIYLVRSAKSHIGRIDDITVMVHFDRDGRLVFAHIRS